MNVRLHMVTVGSQWGARVPMGPNGPPWSSKAFEFHTMSSANGSRESLQQSSWVIDSGERILRRVLGINKYMPRPAVPKSHEKKPTPKATKMNKKMGRQEFY